MKKAVIAALIALIAAVCICGQAVISARPNGTELTAAGKGVFAADNADGQPDAEQNEPITIDYYSQKYGAVEIITVNVLVPYSVKDALNRSADNGNTLENYFERFASLYAALPEACVYEQNEDGISMSIMLMDTYKSSVYGAEDYDVSSERGFFRTRHTLTFDNPLKTMGNKINSYLNSPAEDFDDSERSSWLYAFAAGLEVNGSVVLEGAYELFPALADVSVSENSRFYASKPAWLDKVNYGTMDESGAFMTWDLSLDKVGYTYYVPNSAGWGLTLLLVVAVIVTVLWFVLSRRKEKAFFVDCRPMTDRETASRVSEILNPAPPAAEGGYAGGGLFYENGGTVDVFGNPADSAPASGQNDGSTQRDDESDPFGN